MKLLQGILLLINGVTLLISLFFHPMAPLTLLYAVSLIITLRALYKGLIKVGKVPFIGIIICITFLLIANHNVMHVSATQNSLVLCTILGFSTLSYITFLTFYLPLLRFPSVTGPFAVGTVMYFWKDYTRKEIHSTNPDDVRELAIQVWYPGQFQRQKPLPYIPAVIKFAQEHVGKRIGFPLSIFNNFTQVTTHAYEKIPFALSPNPYPVLLFSHGLGGVCNLNTAHIEELTSHGYIIVGVNHTYTSFVTHFPDGRIVPLNPRFQIHIEKVIKDKPKDYINNIEQEFETWVNDMIFTLDTLETINQDPQEFLYNKCDLEKIGIFGHSLGGALAAEVCRRDKRCKAGASLDGSVFEKTAQGGLSTPFMFITGVLLGENIYPTDKKLATLGMTKEEWDLTLGIYKGYIKNICSKIGEHAYYITIEGAGHFAFTDIALICPLLLRCMTFDIGSLDCSKVTSMTNTYLLKFFDKYIKLKKDITLSKYTYTNV